MTNANNKLGLLEQNLADAGFNQTDSQKFLANFNRGDDTCLQQILQCQRQQLLQTLRHTEFQIDCLDFLANNYH